jgi:hypothetical protein
VPHPGGKASSHSGPSSPTWSFRTSRQQTELIIFFGGEEVD